MLSVEEITLKIKLQRELRICNLGLKSTLYFHISLFPYITYLPEKDFQTPVWQLSGSCQILDLINFQNNQHSWNQSRFWAEIQYSKATHRYAVKIFIYLAPVLKTSRWYIFHPFYLLISPVLWHECQRVFLPAAPQQGMLGDLIVWWALSSLILITMNSGRGHCAWWQFCKVPNQTHREIENWKNVCYKTN